MDLIPTTRQSAPILPGAEQDNEKDTIFEQLLTSLRALESPSQTRQKRLIRQIEGILLAQTMLLSAWQKACGWFYLAQVYFRQERYKSAFEALLQSEQTLPADQPAALAYITSLKVYVALRQGHRLHSSLSCADAYKAMQQMESTDDYHDEADFFQTFMPN